MSVNMACKIIFCLVQQPGKLLREHSPTCFVPADKKVPMFPEQHPSLILINE